METSLKLNSQLASTVRIWGLTYSHSNLLKNCLFYERINKANILPITQEQNIKLVLYEIFWIQFKGHIYDEFNETHFLNFSISFWEQVP